VSLLSVSALETEDYLIVVAVTDDGREVEPETARRLFNLPATVGPASPVSGDGLETAYRSEKQHILGNISQRNAIFFEEEMEKLDRWSDDQKRSLEIQIKELDVEIKQLKTEARKIARLEDKIAQQRKIKTMDKKRTELRRKLFDAQDEIDRQKDSLLDEVEERLRQTVEERTLFSVKWRLF
jgi:Fe2+ transport system protein B